MFPENAKNHPMKTIMVENFKVEHANKERLRKSSIIYMQHLLNEKEFKKWTWGICRTLELIFL